jgi:phosphoesterase RecJ-like protein
MHAPSLIPFWESLLADLSHPIAIIGHIRPDGDSTGSQIALTRVLNALGFQAFMVIEPNLSEILKVFIEGTPFELIDKPLPLNTQWIAVDCADYKRLPIPVEKANLIGLIDHHRSTRPYARWNCIEASYAATAEALTHLIQELSLPIDSITANALYLGILTDTGQFTYNNTTAETLSRAAFLVQKGAQPAQIAHRLFDQKTLPQVALRQIFLKNLKITLQNQACIGVLRTEDFRQTQTTPLDAVDFVDETRRLKGIQIGAYLEEYEGRTKVSLRSHNPELRLDLLAACFGGGGHAAAAGYTLEDQSVEQALQSLEETLVKFIKSS